MTRDRFLSSTAPAAVDVVAMTVGHYTIRANADGPLSDRDARAVEAYVHHWAENMLVQGVDPLGTGFIGSNTISIADEMPTGEKLIADIKAAMSEFRRQEPKPLGFLVSGLIPDADRYGKRCAYRVDWRQLTGDRNRDRLGHYFIELVSETPEQWDTMLSPKNMILFARAARKEGLRLTRVFRNRTVAIYHWKHP